MPLGLRTLMKREWMARRLFAGSLIPRRTSAGVSPIDEAMRSNSSSLQRLNQFGVAICVQNRQYSCDSNHPTDRTIKS
jgi:hypothetical protein